MADEDDEPADRPEHAAIRAERLQPRSLSDVLDDLLDGMVLTYRSGRRGRVRAAVVPERQQDKGGS